MGLREPPVDRVASILDETPMGAEGTRQLAAEIGTSFEAALGLLSGKLQGWVIGAIEILPNFVVSILAFLLFALVSRWVRLAVVRVSGRFTDNRTASRLVGTIARLAVVTLGLFVALSVLKLERAVTSLLAGAGVLGIVVGFAFQEISANFLAGIIIAFEQPYRVGDIVDVKGFRGAVTRIDLRATEIRSFDGLDVILPNKFFLTEPVTNLTQTRDRRVEVRVGVSYAEDLAVVKSVLEETLAATGGILPDRPREVYAYEFGDSSINFLVRGWVEYPGDNDFYRVPDRLVRGIKAAFDERGITIPFPIRTLDFGAKGGTALSPELLGRTG